MFISELFYKRIKAQGQMPIFVKPFPEGSLSQIFLEVQNQLLSLFLGPAEGESPYVVMAIVCH